MPRRKVSTEENVQAEMEMLSRSQIEAILEAAIKHSATQTIKLCNTALEYMRLSGD